MTIPLKTIQDAAATKPDGWLDAVLKAGTVSGRLLHISRARWALLSAKNGQWGDAVATVAKPVARAVDMALGTRVSSCGGCARRHRRLNGGSSTVEELTSPHY